MAVQTVFARVEPQEVKITENYHCTQEISRNPSRNMGRDPTGVVEVSTPYDGHRHFTRDALADVENQIGQGAFPDKAQALVGHLLFNDADRANLSETGSPLNRYGALPITIPVRHRGTTGLDHLSSDHGACKVTTAYTPLQPEIHPIHVKMELLDEDHIRTISAILEREPTDANHKLRVVESQITQSTNFPRNLMLCTKVNLHIPRNKLKGVPEPKITKLSIRWPTITSLQSLKLFTGIGAKTEETIEFNPESRSLEWTDVALHPVADPAERSDMAQFSSDTMLLAIAQPGEIYQCASLTATVDVSIPGVLLSGLRARVFDALGSMRKDLGPHVETRIATTVDLFPEDEFVRRTMSHTQHCHFDEIIPDEMRISDIKSVLADRGFEVLDEISAKPSPEMKHLLHASRREGSDRMGLLIFVKGKQHITQRQTELSSRQTYTSNVESGELQIFMRGELPGDSYAIVREMNTIQLTLRDRFERLKARR